MRVSAARILHSEGVSLLFLLDTRADVIGRMAQRPALTSPVRRSWRGRGFRAKSASRSFSSARFSIWRTRSLEMPRLSPSASTVAPSSRRRRSSTILSSRSLSTFSAERSPVSRRRAAPRRRHGSAVMQLDRARLGTAQSTRRRTADARRDAGEDAARSRMPTLSRGVTGPSPRITCSDTRSWSFRSSR